MRFSGVFLLGALLGVGEALAIPTLQLDIAKGIYVSGTEETVFAQSNPFTLYALHSGDPSAPSGNYYISAAIVPKVGPTPVDFGSFTVNGTSYSATSGMQYGGPPVDSLFPDLPTHGIYNTFYAEIAFTFDLSKKAVAYNSQDNPGGLKQDSSGTMFFEGFKIDISGIRGDYVVHFDLYDEVIHQKKKQTSYDTNFAPFSHDAQSVRVPDGGTTVVMLGIALALLAGFARRGGN